VSSGVAAFAPVVLVFATGTALAAPAVDCGLAPRNGELAVQAHFGVATAPFDVTTLGEAKGQAFVFMAGARQALSEPLSLEVSAPMVLGSVAQPAGSYVDAAALGNPQLGARYQFFERRPGDSALALSAALEVGAPLASHGEDLMANRVLAIADGIEGRGHPEWFTPGVLPITASAALRRTSPRWSLAAELRVPLLVRVSEAHLPGATTNTRSLGVASVVVVEARFRLSERLSLAPAAHIFFDLAPAAQHAPGVSRLQDFERLSLHIHFGLNAALVVDLQTAIGGELSGSTVAAGARVVANFR